MARVTLTDKFIRSKGRTPSTGRKDFFDALVPGLALRVTDKGNKSFVLIARYPLNPKNPTRRWLGDCYLPDEGSDAPLPAEAIQHGSLTLAEAREKARRWIDLVGRGIDPKQHEAKQLAEQLRRQDNSFAAVAAEFLERQASGWAKFKDAKHTIETEFVARWGARPIVDVMPEECSTAIKAIVKRGSPYQAHNAFGYLRQLFSWAIASGEFGITASPMERLRPKALAGKREARTRILKDHELRAVWEAAGQMSYPYGPLLRLMILTGQREREIADMSWPEIDFANALWTIPADRMKSDRAHEVPLAPDALALLQSLPRFTAGDFVFTTTDGLKSVNGFSKAKARIDKQSGVSGWVFHDLRRTTRTHLSALPVQDIVRELVIAHAKPGLHQVYDQHSYQVEKRECLTLWESRLRGILAPKPPADVADLDAERGRRAVA